MSNAFGIKALMPEDAPHILGMGSARTGATDLLLDVWNGSTSAARVFAVQKDGRVWLPDGAVATPALAFTGDLDTGLYRIGANNLGVAVGGSKVVDIGAATIAFTGAVTISSSLTIGGALAGVTNLTASGNITGTWQGGVIGVAYGGTSYSSYLAGDILYATGTTALGQLGIGAANTVLTSSGTAPQWSSSLALGGGLTTVGNVTVGGDLTVVGSTNLTVGSVAASAVTAGTFGAGNYVFPAALTVTTTLGVTGATTLSSTLAVTSFATVGGYLDVTGDVYVGAELDVTGDIILPAGSSIQGVTGATPSAVFCYQTGTVATTGGSTSIARVRTGTAGQGLYVLVADSGHAVLFSINGSSTVLGFQNLAGTATYFVQAAPGASEVQVTCSGVNIDIQHGASVGGPVNYTLYQLGA